MTSPHIAGPTLTLADIAAYEEIGQLASPNACRIGLGLADLSSYPDIEAWLARIGSLPHHDSAHEGFSTLKHVVEKKFKKQNLTAAKL